MFSMLFLCLPDNISLKVKKKVLSTICIFASNSKSNFGGKNFYIINKYFFILNLNQRIHE